MIGPQKQRIAAPESGRAFLDEGVIRITSRTGQKLRVSPASERARLPCRDVDVYIGIAGGARDGEWVGKLNNIGNCAGCPNVQREWNQEE